MISFLLTHYDTVSYPPTQKATGLAVDDC